MRNPQLNKNGELQHLLTIDGLPRDVITAILDTALPFAAVAEPLGMQFRVAFSDTVTYRGIMFTGVFAVFLGTAYGVRRVLLVSGAIFTVTSMMLPTPSW